MQVDRVVTDFDALLKSLTPAQKRLVTKTVVDKEKLEAAIALGKIETTAVTAVSEMKANKPFLKITGQMAALPTPPVNPTGVAGRRVKVKRAKP